MNFLKNEVNRDENELKNKTKSIRLSSFPFAKIVLGRAENDFPKDVAEMERFELSKRFHVYMISNHAPSTS